MIKSFKKIWGFNHNPKASQSVVLAKPPNPGHEVHNAAGQSCYASDSQLKMMGFKRKKPKSKDLVGLRTNK